LNYEEQQEYFDQSRWFGATAAAVFILSAFWFFAVVGASTSTIAHYWLFVAALTVSVLYSPDYLHFTANPEKRISWSRKIRSRIVVAILSILVISAFPLYGSGWPPRLWILLWTVWPWLALKKIHRSFAIWAWFGDWFLIVLLTISYNIPPLLFGVLLCAAAHLFVLSSPSRPVWILVNGVTLFTYLVLLSLSQVPATTWFYVPAVLFISVMPLATFLLSEKAGAMNATNVSLASAELIRLTGFGEDTVRFKWATSNQQLARNWEAAKLDEADAEKMAAWYCDNSELYMFAISAYNLEYKRIKSNLAMMKYGRGKCLDYGAGNGDLILEMARRGHPAVYYDVDGTSAKFAKSRADQRGLNVEFSHSKDGLRESAARQGFDTIFSFDVLEHIPDLAGELDFLSSLLAPGGHMIFDVPAGSTKAHPMHLNHNLNVRGHMLAKGFAEEKLGWSFRKQEKYIFRRPINGEKGVAA
jgi:2-polyprenyl-3-methyl-5-hydroxy-6-metoxy-1,4-benzoquinol methylase